MNRRFEDLTPRERAREDRRDMQSALSGYREEVDRLHKELHVIAHGTSEEYRKRVMAVVKRWLYGVKNPDLRDACLKLKDELEKLT